MYNELYEAWKKEKENGELQTLPRDFYSRLTTYVKSLKEESRMLDRKALKARLMFREFENVIERLKNIRQTEIHIAGAVCKVATELDDDQKKILSLLQVKL